MQNLPIRVQALVAAKRYLAAVALLNAIIPVVDYMTRARGVHTIVEIALREGSIKSIVHIVEHFSFEVDTDTLTMIAPHVGTLLTNLPVAI